jgi:hypothetical protein
MSDRLGYDLPEDTLYSPPDVFGTAQLWANGDDAKPDVHTRSTRFSKTFTSVRPLPSKARDKKQTHKLIKRAEWDFSSTKLGLLEEDLEGLTTNVPSRWEPGNTLLQVSPSSALKVEEVQLKDPELVTIASLLQRNRRIFRLIKRSIELQDSPEPAGAQVENFWILQSAAVVEAEDARKQQLINKIGMVVDGVLQPKVESPPEDVEAPKTPTLPRTDSTDISPTNAEGSNRTGKRKFRSTTPTGESNNEDSGSEENDRSPKSAKHTSQGSLRLACPYFRRNPQKYMEHRTCVGPGWTTVHRVK